jgi:hypothetical protein
VVLHPELELLGALERLVELVLVEGDADVVDARKLPLPGLDDDVHAAALELREPELEAAPVELLPRDARLERGQVLGDPAVAGDQVETELAEIPGLDLAHLARDEVVVEQVHRRAILRFR